MVPGTGRQRHYLGAVRENEMLCAVNFPERPIWSTCSLELKHYLVQSSWKKAQIGGRRRKGKD